MARPPEKYTAIFTTVAEALGGVLVPEDWDNKALFFPDPQAEDGHFEVESKQILAIEGL